MAKLIYAMPTSLDGYIQNEAGDFQWAAPSEEFLVLINDLLRPVGTYLYGRKMYETMAVWETPEVIPDLTAASRDFAEIWQSAHKIVYSKSLERVSTAKTRLEPDFDAQTVRDLKARSPHGLSIGGPTIAEPAFQAGLVDEIHLFVVPILLGGGKRALPSNVLVKLDLLEERRLADGWVYLRYRVAEVIPPSRKP